MHKNANFNSNEVIVSYSSDKLIMHVVNNCTADHANDESLSYTVRSNIILTLINGSHQLGMLVTAALIT
jgi:hypothetical protein